MSDDEFAMHMIEKRQREHLLHKGVRYDPVTARYEHLEELPAKKSGKKKKHRRRR